VNFVKTIDGDLSTINTSDKITFSPSSGELSINSIRETTNNETRVNISSIDETYSMTFVKTLAPKKYSMTAQPSLDRFGFLPEDISAVYNNIGMVNNSGICYSEMIAPIVSVLQSILTKLDAIDERISQLETNFASSSTTIAPMVAATAAAEFNAIDPPAIETSSVNIDTSSLDVPTPSPSQEQNYSENVDINNFVTMIAEAKKQVMNSYI
jgi:hypothetical protein